MPAIFLWRTLGDHNFAELYVLHRVWRLLGCVDVRPEKFQFLEKRQNRNFDYKIVISVKKIRNLFSRSRITKRIALLESSREF